MTKTIIEIAREAGCYEKYEVCYFLEEELERFAALVRKDEREKLNHSGESTDMVQEPVGYFATDSDGFLFQLETTRGLPLYTAPPTAAKAARQMRDAAVKVCDYKYESCRFDDYRDACQDIARLIADLPVPEVKWRDLTVYDVTEAIREGAADGGWHGFAEQIIKKFKEKQL